MSKENVIDRVSAILNEARELNRQGEKLLVEAFPVGTVISFKRGNMIDIANAEVLMVSGRRIKILNQFSAAVRLIDFLDIAG